jgi:uncharacterized membrane protein YhhN
MKTFKIKTHRYSAESIVKKIDKVSLAFGVILSLCAQGLYETIFYAYQGKTNEEWAALIATIGTVVILILALYWKGYFKDAEKKKE